MNSAGKPGGLHRWLLVAFLASLAVTSFFAVRFTLHAIYWVGHRDEPISSWMTVGYVAHAYRVDPATLQAALGLPASVPDRRPLGEIATATGRSVSELTAALEAEIARQREQGAPPPG